MKKVSVYWSLLVGLFTVAYQVVTFYGQDHSPGHDRSRPGPAPGLIQTGNRYQTLCLEGQFMPEMRTGSTHSAPR